MRVLLVVYDVENGAIARRVSCQEELVALQAGEGQSVLVIERGVDFSDATHFVDISADPPVLKLRV